MACGHVFVRLTHWRPDYHRAGFEHFAGFLVDPCFPQSRRPDKRVVGKVHVIGLLAAILGFRPFIPTVHWDDAAPRAERGLEGGFIRHFFAARVEDRVFPCLGSSAPRGN